MFELNFKASPKLINVYQRPINPKLVSNITGFI